MKTPSLRIGAELIRAISVSALIIGGSAPLIAQTTPVVPSGYIAPAKQDEAIVLSPFTVSTSKDLGYDTQETLSGTRLKTPNKFVGAAISELNQQFMQDLAILSVKDVIDFTANAVAYDNGRMGSSSDQTTNAAITASNQFNIRGAHAGPLARPHGNLQPLSLAR